jgi:hypothetical protein
MLAIVFGFTTSRPAIVGPCDCQAPIDGTDLLSSAAMTAAAGMSTATTGMAYANTAAATSTAMVSATTATVTASIASAIIGAVVVATVVEIAVAADDPAEHAGDHTADNGSRIDVPDLLDQRVRLYQLGTSNAGHAGQSGRRRKYHPGPDDCCNLQQSHLTILLLGKEPTSRVIVFGSEGTTG